MKIEKEQFITALSTEGVLRDGNLELLSHLFFSKDCKGTAGQLAEQMGYIHLVSVNSLLGNLGKRVAHFLKIELPEREFNSPGWWKIICHGEQRDEGFTWYLREELSSALIEMGMLGESDELLYPDQITANSVLLEGKQKQINVNAFERNQTARKVCIQEFGVICQVCNFDFKEKYGELGTNFIHVHHIVDIATIGEEYKVDPINDLRPVCPNCHAMLHQRKPALSVGVLKKIVAENS